MSEFDKAGWPVDTEAGKVPHHQTCRSRVAFHYREPVMKAQCDCQHHSAEDCNWPEDCYLHWWIQGRGPVTHNQYWVWRYQQDDATVINVRRENGEIILEPNEYPSNPKVEPQLGRPNDFPKQEEAPELVVWWRKRSEDEAEAAYRKSVEYGGSHRASDLVELGGDLADLMGKDSGTLSEADLQELGIYFYLSGKLGRWKAALLEGKKVSDDTIADIKVYATMVQRIRDKGGWPV